MNKYDKLLIVIIILGSIFAYVPLLIGDYQSKGSDKEVVVQYMEEIVLRVPLNKDKTYIVDGLLGDVYVEVLDDKVRIEKENSPYHLCSIQGWISDVNRPIICLPNKIVVRIVTTKPSDDEVDSVVQ